MSAPAQDTPDQVFRATVNVVIAPVTVTDRDGNFVSGLEPHHFRLLDNGKPQDIKVDVSFIPISLVVAVQANAAMEEMLPKVQKVGSVLQQLVVGEQGEIAIVAFDHRIQTLQDFTSDPDKIIQALGKLRPGSTSSRMIDAVSHSIRMLSRRPSNRRRVLLLISETRDVGSEGRLRDAITDAQLHNVLIYTVNVPHVVTLFTSKPQPPRPDPYPPTARPLPPNVPPTPETVRATLGTEGRSGNLIPLFIEIFRQVKGIFVSNPAEVFTKYTGGREYSFTTQRDLERALGRIGEELHSQYIISYTPNNKMEAGFHEIEVQVLEGSTGRIRKDLKVLTRPGYWLAAVPEG
ncbi:MAG: VWA domain-containing protein [Bryobacterales bacterium]|nr:VWA domain-containing protein [Bryobacterales bacterium]